MLQQPADCAYDGPACSFWTESLKDELVGTFATCDSAVSATSKLEDTSGKIGGTITSNCDSSVTLSAMDPQNFFTGGTGETRSCASVALV